MFSLQKNNPLLPSALFLIAANVMPLFGVLFWGWSVGAILLIYWLESAIIGVLNIPRILATQGKIGEKLFTSLFFTVHYGLFAAAHLALLHSMFGADTALSELFQGGPLMWTTLSFFLSHLISFVMRLWRKEFKDSRPMVQLFAPYSRVMIMHIVVLAGAFLIELLGSPIFAVILLVALKTGVDIKAHIREGREARALESLALRTQEENS